jgi:hypothetical protein
MYWPANATPAVVCLLVTIAMGSWFASEAVKTGKERSNVRYLTSMLLMIVAAIGALIFGGKVLKGIRNGNAVAPNAVNMPSNAAGAANVPVPGGPAPNSNGAATNAGAVKITVA